jgi:hypothetical protein
LGLTVLLMNGLPGRVSDTVLRADAERQNTNPHKSNCYQPSNPCNVEQVQNTARVIMLGNSHADALAEALLAAIPGGKQGDMLLLAFNGCPTVEGVR